MKRDEWEKRGERVVTWTCLVVLLVIAMLLVMAITLGMLPMI